MHSFSKVIEDFQFDIYDVPGEVITQQTFSSQPEAFRYCDGLIFMIDPLSVESVRAELEQDGEIGAIENYSTDNVAQTFDMFIAQFKALNGLRANEMSDIPVSIIISKTDVKVVKREIGRAKIRTEFKKNPQKYNNESSACDAICREYLCDILNLGNIVSNVEASFRNIKFFPVSAMGHTASMTEPAAYEPIGVIEPVAWIAKTTRAKNGHLLNSAKTGGGLS